MKTDFAGERVPYIKKYLLKYRLFAIALLLLQLSSYFTAGSLVIRYKA